MSAPQTAHVVICSHGHTPRGCTFCPQSPRCLPLLPHPTPALSEAVAICHPIVKGIYRPQEVIGEEMDRGRSQGPPHFTGDSSHVLQFFSCSLPSALLLGTEILGELKH